MSNITPIVMPKWGLEMREGTVVAWLVDEGARIEVGTPIIDVETDKISNAVEAPDPGLLRRQVAQAGDTLPVKALLGVLAAEDVADDHIDRYIAGYVVPTAEADEDAGGPASELTEVAGLTVRYVRRGPAQGVPVLFLHGFGGDLDNWLFNLDAVAEVAPVIALDLPGHGQSTPRLPGTGLRDFASFVARFLDRLDIERVHLVGHSLGGAIAARLALDHPGRVASLVLLNSAGLGVEIDSGYVDGFVAALSRRELKPVVERLFADPGRVTRQMVDDLLKYKRIDGVREALTALSTGLFPGGRQAETPGLDLEGPGMPVLVVWGREDGIIPASHAVNAPPGANVVLFEGVGHMAMMEKASEVNALIRRQVAG